jgi:prepilin-type N-terminal cleavage/methylation domain-containing protein
VKKKIKTYQGFTFIEVMLAVVIITITSMGLMYGVVHSRSELRALEIKERATEELSNYMEHWKGRIASGNLSSTDKLGDYTGKEIYLVGDAQADEKVTAKLFYSMDKQDSQYNDANYESYRLKVWIQWKNFMKTPESAVHHDLQIEQERILETVMLVYGV